MKINRDVITKAYSKKATPEEVQTAFDEVARREPEILKRLHDIGYEDGLYGGPERTRILKSGSIEDIQEIDAEFELLKVEQEQLFAWVDDLLKLQEAAEQRAARPLLKPALKALPAILKKAEAVHIEWLAAKQELNEHVGLVGTLRGLIIDGKHKATPMNEEDFYRIEELLDWNVPIGTDISIMKYSPNDYWGASLHSKHARCVRMRVGLLGEEQETATKNNIKRVTGLKKW